MNPLPPNIAPVLKSHNKKDLYERLSVMYYLEPYKHPMVTKKYLLAIDEDIVWCPTHADRLLYYNVRIDKSILAALLLEQDVNLGFGLTSLPSKQWMLSALRAIDPMEQLVVFLLMKIDRIKQALPLTPPERQNLCDLNALIAERCTELTREFKRKWNEKLLLEFIEGANELITEYPFLTTSAQLEHRLNMFD